MYGGRIKRWRSSHGDGRKEMMILVLDINFEGLGNILLRCPLGSEAQKKTLVQRQKPEVQGNQGQANWSQWSVGDHWEREWRDSTHRSAPFKENSSRQGGAGRESGPSKWRQNKRWQRQMRDGWGQRSQEGELQEDRVCAVLSCFSHDWLFVTLWTVACQAPLSMGFSRQEYWSGLPCPPPDPGIKPVSLVSCTSREILYCYHHLGS